MKHSGINTTPILPMVQSSYSHCSASGDHVKVGESVECVGRCDRATPMVFKRHAAPIKSPNHSRCQSLPSHIYAKSNSSMQLLTLSTNKGILLTFIVALMAVLYIHSENHVRHQSTLSVHIVIEQVHYLY